MMAFRSSAHTGLGWGVRIAIILALGCKTLEPAAAPSRPARDPCADRLHDICGRLLLYHSIHGRLPERIEDLQGTSGPGEKLVFQCPASGEPYLYDRDGIGVPGQPGPVILQDKLPSHSGIRWAIAVVMSDPAQPLNTRVVALAKAPPVKENPQK